MPHNLNFSFAGIEGEALMTRVSDTVALSSGSACTSASIEPGADALKPWGAATRAHSSLRISYGRFSTEADIAQALACIRSAVLALQAISPLAVPAGLGFVGR